MAEVICTLREGEPQNEARFHARLMHLASCKRVKDWAGEGEEASSAWRGSSFTTSLC